jgi:hypothetical protein
VPKAGSDAITPPAADCGNAAGPIRSDDRPPGLTPERRPLPSKAGQALPRRASRSSAGRRQRVSATDQPEGRKSCEPTPGLTLECPGLPTTLSHPPATDYRHAAERSERSAADDGSPA